MRAASEKSEVLEHSVTLGIGDVKISRTIEPNSAHAAAEVVGGGI